MALSNLFRNGFQVLAMTASPPEHAAEPFTAKTNERIIVPPPLSDERPRAQGFNDWIVFGAAANAFSAKMIGYEEYNAGKQDAVAWWNRKR